MIGVGILILLLGHVAAHVVLIVMLRQKVSLGRLALSFFLTPLAPYFAFRSGLSRPAWFWLGTLLAYAAAVGLVRGCV